MIGITGNRPRNDELIRREMGKKLIFLDIDGTLTIPGSNEPPESALRAIRAAQKKGHLVFLCSGRNPGMLAPLLKYDFDGVIACAGGYVTVGDELIYDMPMTREESDLAVEKLHGEGVFCTIESRDGAWGDANVSEFIEDSIGADSKGNSEIERWRKALSGSLGIRPMKEYDGSPLYKVVIMCLRYEQLEPAREALEDRYNFCMQEITDPAHRCINGELINRKYDKGRAILRVCDYLGIPVIDTYGFGDSMNDLEMIQTVGTSVCMDNGAEALKKISDVVCPRVEEDGLAKAFEQLDLV